MTIADEWNKGKDKRRIITKLREQFLKVKEEGEDLENEIIELFYKLFENYSSKTHKTNIKVKDRFVILSQVGIMLGYEKGDRIDSIEELVQVFSQADKILPYINRKAKKELLMIWEEVLTDIPQINSEMKVNKVLITGDKVDSIKLDKNGRIETYYKGDEQVTINLKGIEDIGYVESWATVELISDEIISLLKNYIDSYSTFNLKANKIYKNLKDKCSKWLIVLKIGEKNER